MSTLRIRRFVPADAQGVMGVILPIQREEFGIPITAEDQPDLHSIPSFYQSGVGDFLVAEEGGHVVGTVGLKDIGAGQAALRKMFVAPAWRGREHGVAQALLQNMLGHARGRAVRDIFLGTTDAFAAAHRFYEKNGFRRIDPRSLPGSFPRMAVDTRFYGLRLGS
ncbi:GNAT family N-acetyltransferase [Gluconacetobacter azotocaptans]|uniref:GNAT family N-acetyltransferase n=1 Tax=Gluconacetobacter azotocaptans TaxID=142834 RepID=A0A7W4PEY5_9PROT|nr:GNAT family N-acetyltransferase [Gluconacetobacter azotocaptans]MBB2191278.1 GNAT family N-acetyltransferase [Gluconacetobacter azotocaptans]GBQ33840.1 N-acetyltransferase GCN5 [Gluconacetobacter azotocaptans DSM 13594]